MKYIFIQCTDENIKNKLMNQLELISEQIINGKTTYIFENNNKIKFSNNDLSKITFTNKFYI